MLDINQLKKLTESEITSIRKEKDSVILTNDRYNTPNTSLLLFHFEPNPFASTDLRLNNCTVKHHAIAGKDIYLFDEFFYRKKAKTSVLTQEKLPSVGQATPAKKAKKREKNLPVL